MLRCTTVPPQPRTTTSCSLSYSSPREHSASPLRFSQINMRKLSVINRSHEVLLVSGSHTKSRQPSSLKHDDYTLLHPSAHFTCAISQSRCRITISSQEADELDEKWVVKPNSLTLRIPLALGASVKALKTPDECPWVLYLGKVLKNENGL